MGNESFSVNCSVVTWTLWALAALLLTAASLYVWISPAPIVWKFAPLIWWGLFAVAAAGTWSVQTTITRCQRKTASKLERIERRMASDRNTHHHADEPPLRSLR